jgi:hypothetical protein
MGCRFMVPPFPARGVQLLSARLRYVPDEVDDGVHLNVLELGCICFCERNRVWAERNSKTGMLGLCT